MLFPYKQPRHKMRMMHSFITYIFNKVWCRAPNVEYSIELFKGLPPLYAIMNELYRADLVAQDSESSGNKQKEGAGAFFYHCVNQIFIEFKQLKPEKIQSYKKIFMNNNDVRALCEGRKEPSRYAIKSLDALEQKIKAFFSKLYTSQFFELTIVKNQIDSDLKDYYKRFAELNKMPCCPFCGLMPMDSEFDPTREAYDHYLPASKYPFNSVNLKNLTPACYKCNSQNKGANDPLQDKDGNRKKAFYSYVADQYPIEVSVRFSSNSQLPKKPEHISIDLSCPGYEEEVQTWDRLYKIRERYIAKCLSSTSDYWLQRILDEKNNYNQDILDILDTELELSRKHPWHDVNFLKVSFLQACNLSGIFKTI